jgi:hypothetical protein
MANTDITLTTQDGAVSTDIESLAVVNGDTFSVSAKGDAVSLFFSPDLANALSPAPSNPSTLSDGQSTAFTFTSSNPGGYFITCAAGGLEVDLTFPSEISTTLHVQTLIAVPPPPPPPPPVPIKNTGPILNPQGTD